MKIKRLAALITALLALGGCTPVDMDVTESFDKESESVSQTESLPAEESSVYYEEESSALPESSAPAVIERPAIFDKSYEERAAYFGEHWEVEYDLNDAYFNNSVFVGNSIMLHYSNYATKQRQADKGFLGNAAFFAAASFSLYNNKHQTAESKDCALPSFRGQQMNITDAIGEMKVDTAYLSLMALNDIAIYKDGPTGIIETYNLFTSLVDELKSAYPQLKIVVMSNTYLHSSSDRGTNKLNNGSISDLNIRVLDYCNSNGIDFIDVSTILMDNSDCLGTEFCSDIGSNFACHLTGYAYNAWTFILRDYAARKIAGVWENPTYMDDYVSK